MEPEREWTVEALVDHVSADGYAITARQLEAWRNQGLLPAQNRGPQRGLRPTWTSPPGTGEALLHLLELRKSTKDPDVLLLTLWLAGGRQPLERVRTALLATLKDAEQAVQQEIQKIRQRHVRSGAPPGSDEEALRDIARGLAVARVGDAVLPRLRSGSRYRLPGATTMWLMFVTGRVPNDARGENVERAMGMLPRGRLDRLNPGLDRQGVVGPWHDGEPLDLSLLAKTVSLPALKSALETASDEDLLYARAAIGPLTHGLSLVIRFLSAFHYDRVNFMGWGMLGRRPRSPEWPAFVLCAVLAMRQNEMRDNLEAVVQALAQAQRTLTPGLRRLLLTPPAARRKWHKRLGPKMGARLSKVVDEFAPKPSEL